MRLRFVEDGKVHKDLCVIGESISIGRDPASTVAVDGVVYAKVSWLHAEIRRQNGKVFLVHRSQSNRTLCNNIPVDTYVSIKPGDKIRLGISGPTIEVVSLEDTLPPKAIFPSKVTLAPADASTPNESPTLFIPANQKATSSLGSANQIVVGKGGTIGRDAKNADFQLNHPNVSRTHAKLSVRQGRVSLTDLGSANGTYINGIRLKVITPLNVDDIVDIGPFSLVFDGQCLASRSRANNVQLVVKNVSRVVQESGTRRSLSLLQDISLVLNPGEFLGIIGPSGSGKSTLLGVISGRDRPSKGNVSVNSRDLHANFAALKEDLAVVPQSTMLHDSLTVEQTLRYTAALRLPPDLNPKEVSSVVDGMIETIGLSKRRKVMIRQLSGGQLKRAGLGGELLAEPSLLFLDEVTSGLDEHSDGEMMRLFRSLADSGKTLACVTHNLSHVDTNCHLVAVLTVGGRLAFFGSPSDAKQYFRVDNLADIYLELEKRRPEEWSSAFVLSPEYKTNISQRMPKSNLKSSSLEAQSQGGPAPTYFRQVIVLIRRSIAVWRGDYQALAALFGQALLVAILLCMVFGNIEDADYSKLLPFAKEGKIRNILFLLGVSCFWLGCNNSVKELVKERRIFLRERDFNLLPESYLTSKLFVMLAVGIAQSMLLGLLVLTICQVKGDLITQLMVLSTLSLAGTTLGLAISAVSKTEELAVAMVPIVIIPQIILAGVVAELSSFPEAIAKIAVTVYWGQKGVESLLGESRIASDFEPKLATCLILIAIHAAVFTITAWWGVRWKKLARN